MHEPSWLVPLARDAEELGFDAVSLGDSLVYPRHSSTRYPYTPSGDRSFIEGKPFVDPLVAAAAILTATTRLAFQTSVLKLGVRHPVVVAKQAASVAALAPGRLRLGVGSSPWPEDFAVMGVPHERRGARFEDAIRVVQRLLVGGYQSYTGPVYEIPELRIDPMPPVPVPILVGGHGPENLRRAGQLGDGWIAASPDLDELRTMVATLTRHRSDAGREQQPFSVHAAIPRGRGPEVLDEMEALGVTDVVVRPSLDGSVAADLAEARRCLERTATSTAR